MSEVGDNLRSFDGWGVSVIRVIHGYRFMYTDNEHFPHEVTVVATDNGFQYLYRGVTDASANRRVAILMEGVSENKLEREREGNPYTVEDYLQISRIGMTIYFFDSGGPYESSMPLEEVLNCERAILEESRVKYVPATPRPKSEGIDFQVVPLIKSLVLPPMTPEIREEVEGVLSDFPELIPLINRFANERTPGLVELIFALVGPIHPDGPNGWFLAYLEDAGVFGPDDSH